MNRLLTFRSALCLAMALASPSARADGVAPRDERAAGQYRTHALSPGSQFGPDGADPCQRLAGARWAPDYVAGVDAYGRPVAPPDLDTDSADDTAPVVTFDLPVGERTGKAGRSDMIAGTVTVETGTGLVELDGRPLNLNETERLRERCFDR